MNRGFARLYRIDRSEAAAPPDAYPSLSAFFVRTLRPGVRPFPTESGVAASPVDGIVGACGPLVEGVAIQAKGLGYSVAALLGEEPTRLRSGFFITIYLSPRHYHRVHAPIDGDLRVARAIPGRLLPVGPLSVRSVPELFPRNERLVAIVEREATNVGLVAVGAFNVGRISAAFDPGWGADGHGGVTNRKGRLAVETRRYDPPLRIERGAELMAFHLGSTVVLVLESRRGALPALAPGIRPGVEVRLGQPLFAGPLP